MNVTAQEIIHDLIASPGLGMFAWLCLVFFAVAFVFFMWALKSGQLSNMEESKYTMLEDDNSKIENPKSTIENRKSKIPKEAHNNV